MTYANLYATFLLFFVKFANCIANAPWIAEERTCRIKTFSGDFGDSAVEPHLTADLVAGVPSVGFGFVIAAYRSMINDNQS